MTRVSSTAETTFIVGHAEAVNSDVNSGRLRRSNSSVCRRRENRLARISLSIVWLFLFCHAWKLLPTAYEAFVGEIAGGPIWLRHVQHISHAMIVLNSSLNFLIYLLM